MTLGGGFGDWRTGDDAAVREHAIDGSLLGIGDDTLCGPGDAPQAAEFAAWIRAEQGTCGVAARSVAQQRSGDNEMTVDWPEQIYRELAAAGVRQVAYVPDAGHRSLIERCHRDRSMKTVSLTTEEEGVAMLVGAWLGGERGVLLIQSSGVGNCINLLSLNQECRIPLLMLVTMRGEWGEFNSWQLPMGQATSAALRAANVLVYRTDKEEDVVDTVRACAALAFNSGRAVAVLIGQRVIGTKTFE